LRRPALALAGSFAAFDDRIIDAGIRAAARVAGFVSRLVGFRIDLLVDRAVNSLATVARLIARASSVADDRGVDATIEVAARGVGAVGAQSRRLQTGLAHQYYVIVAIGTVLLIAAAALGTLAKY